MSTVSGEKSLVVIGAGKAAAAMAAVVEAHYPADATLSGVVLTRYGHAEPTTRIPVIEAGHPLPDHQGECAAARVQAIVRQAQVGDSLLVLLSGGASSLLTLNSQRALPCRHHNLRHRFCWFWSFWLD